MRNTTLANALGWFSLGLGAVEVAAPGRLAEVLGLRQRSGLLRGFGLREIGAGLGLLGFARKSPWLWGRVAGDALDLAVLASAAVVDDERNRARETALALVAGITLLDVLCAVRASR